MAAVLPSGGAASPLGRFADVITAIASISAIAAALLAHLAVVFGIAGSSDAFLDSLAILAFGVLYGTARGISASQASGSSLAQTALDTVNANTRALVDRADLNTALAKAAHDRLDAMRAPAAPVDHTGLVAGDPTNGTTNGT